MRLKLPSPSGAILAAACVAAVLASACGDSAGAADAGALDAAADEASGDAADAAAAEVVSDASAGDTIAGTDTAPPWTPQTVDHLFAADRVLTVAITLPPDDWDTLRTQSRTLLDILGGDCLASPVANPFTWFEADVTVGGVARTRVGVRKKGFLGSLSPVKPSLKLKLDEFVSGQRLAGAKRITLNNARQDPGYLNQCLTYGLYAAAGLPAPRCSFARVAVNGADLGLYVHVESIKKPFLAEVFGDDDGDLYEGALSDFRTEWLGTFERKTNESGATLADLEALSAALELPDEQLLDALDALIDLDGFLRFWALEVITAHVDGYASNTNNYYIYKHPEDGRFRFIVWGADAVFDARVDEDVPVAQRPPVSVFASGVLARRLYLHPVGRARYEAALRSLLDDPWDGPGLQAEAARMRTLLSPHVADDERVAFDLKVDALLAFVATRRGAILGELDAGTARWDAPLRPDPCWETVGTLSGSVTTTWGSHDAENPLALSSGSLSGSYGDTALQILDMGGTIGPGTGEELGAAIFRGIAVLSGGAILVLQVTLPPALVNTGDVVPVDFVTATGVLFRLPGTPGGDVDFLGYVGDGSVSFERASRMPGATVEVDFELTVISP